MLHIKSLEIGKPLFDALNSDIRISILTILMEKGEINFKQLAQELGVTNGAITAHIKKLEVANLVKIHAEPASRGSQKICRLKCSKVILDFFDDAEKTENIYIYNIKIGHYVDYKIKPTCGITTPYGIVGEFDDTRYFSFPERFDAGLLWFASGYLEYIIPNNLKLSQYATELQIQVEISSEAPGFSSHFPSDIYFEINGLNLGFCTLPGEFNDRKGLISPSWWIPHLAQYGRIKMISITKTGTYIYNQKISTTTIDDLSISCETQIRFRIGVHENAENVGGINLFGDEFGDYNYGILTRMFYEEKSDMLK